jgi:hypothetical protein
MTPIRIRWAITTRRLMILIAAVAVIVGFAKPIYERQMVIGTATAFLEKTKPGSTRGGPQEPQWIEGINAWKVAYYSPTKYTTEWVYVTYVPHISG